MQLAQVVPILIPALFVTFAIVERIWPARPLPTVKWWRVKGVAFFALSGVLSAAVPSLYVDFFRAHRLMDLEGLGTIAGIVIGFLAVELAAYAWHRLRHATVLWRLAHQMHHSAERLDIYGAVYGHPAELVATNLVTALVTMLVLGIGPNAAAVVGVLVVGCAMFQHTNVRTPAWLGYLIQRPESHSIHHARGVHAFNYCDLPLWDIAFGTFRNPERFEPTTGFYDGASRRLGAMLVGRDVSSV
jgi:sterol desaturase/sphingolipid hydroxylase (fatty acid hydroxylase superfamily)